MSSNILQSLCYLLPVSIFYICARVSWNIIWQSKDLKYDIHYHLENMVDNNTTSTSANDSFGLCVMVYGTTTNERYITEMKEILNIYSNRSEVYFFMDDFGDIEDYKLCNILSDPSRCIWVKPKINNKTLYGAPGSWQTYGFGIDKTRSVFTAIKQRKLYNKCNFMIKSESDAYVDIDRYSDWLNNNFIFTDDIYIGGCMICSWPTRFIMANGIFTISRGIFVNHPNLIFNNKTIGDYYHEDCSFGYLMTEILHVNVTDDMNYITYGRDQMKLWNQWKQMSVTDKQCYFSCHKCTGLFRNYWITEMEKIKIDTNHCRHKNYLLYQGLGLNNGTLKYETIKVINSTKHLILNSNAI